MNFLRKKMVLSMALLGLTSMVSANVYAGGKPDTTTTTETNYVAMVTPTAGTATVDGNISEWNTSAGSPDFSAKMCTRGSIGADGNCEGSGKVQLSTMYSRYDCNTDTMYVLVLRAGNHWPDKSADNAWVKIYNLSQSPQVDGSSSTFSWVAPNGVQGSTLIGYEASFKLAAGTYNDAQVHLNVSGETSSTGKNGDTMTITVPTACTMPASGSTETPATSGSTETPATSGSTETPATSGSTDTPATSGSTETPATSGSTETPATSGNTETTADCSGTDGADAPTSTTVSWADDQGTNSYDFAVTREGNTWTYQVDKAGGKDLSHWTLIVPSCVAKVSDATNGVETGQDGSIKDRNVSGIKWNSEGGTFSFTLDGDYAVSTVEVLAKAGNGYSTSMIMGPDCSMPASNACPPPVVVKPTITGAFYESDESICSFIPKAVQDKNGNDLKGWTLPQWIAVNGYIEATNGSEPAAGLSLALVGNDTVKICPAGVMAGSCHESDASDVQPMVTNEDGKIDFAALVYWPGVPSADRDNGAVNSSYSIGVMGGAEGTEVLGGLSKKLLWNHGMMNNKGCTITLKKRSHK